MNSPICKASHPATVTLTSVDTKNIKTRNTICSVFMVYLLISIYSPLMRAVFDCARRSPLRPQNSPCSPPRTSPYLLVELSIHDDGDDPFIAVTSADDPHEGIDYDDIDGVPAK